jgi:IS4 transposase
LYSLRWQIELFFKELKSTLGFHQYQFQTFAAVEGWMELCSVSAEVAHRLS